MTANMMRHSRRRQDDSRCENPADLGERCGYGNLGRIHHDFMSMVGPPIAGTQALLAVRELQPVMAARLTVEGAGLSVKPPRLLFVGPIGLPECRVSAHPLTRASVSTFRNGHQNQFVDRNSTKLLSVPKKAAIGHHTTGQEGQIPRRGEDPRSVKEPAPSRARGEFVGRRV